MILSHCLILRKLIAMENLSKNKFLDIGATVPSNTVFLEITRGTEFEDDTEMQKYIDMFSKVFADLIESKHGTFAIQSLDGAIKSIKNRQTFVSSVQLTSRLVQKLDIDPAETCGLFVGCIGIIITLVSHPGPDTTVSTELQDIISQTYQLIFYTALVPFWNGTRNSIANFFSCEFVKALDIGN